MDFKQSPLDFNEMFDKKAIEKFELDTNILKLQTFLSDKFHLLFSPFQK